ncbi:hypothetical protein CMI37_15175 [Candidatus Pacearchaeota archaeon]|nr:hypothetical protein [Candidatus Pacearchaeota archaeon]|tara:strand:+ start:298 stop:849 length:552 start_codon:yes stop_codon:yes gene_type:complete
MKKLLNKILQAFGLVLLSVNRSLSRELKAERDAVAMNLAEYATASDNLRHIIKTLSARIQYSEASEKTLKHELEEAKQQVAVRQADLETYFNEAKALDQNLRQMESQYRAQVRQTDCFRKELQREREDFIKAKKGLTADKPQGIVFGKLGSNNWRKNLRTLSTSARQAEIERKLNEYGLLKTL